jgi:glucose-1-phosphate adenylyltransferase
MQDVLSLILGGGRGAGLYPLTKWRSAPAVPVGGQYRLIDIPISNCINSGLQRIYVLTQFLSVSLHRHIARTYKFAPFSRGFVEVLAAQQTNEATDWYRGTADAVRQNVRYLTADSCADVLILCGDGLYRMNFCDVVRTHRERRADLTIAVIPVRRSQAPKLGVVRLDDDDRLTDLVEKPQAPEQLESLRAPAAWLERRGLAGGNREHLANTGIYLCRREVLLEMLAAQPQATDLVTELFARNLQAHRVQAHLFDGYWEDLGSIKTYHEASLALTGPNPPFDFHSAEGVIYTHMRNLPASQVRGAHLEQALVSEGCLIQRGARVERCVIGLRTRVGRDATLRATVVCGADYYETEDERAANRPQRLPDVGVGERSLIERAILDKNCRIGTDVRIVNQRGLREAEGDNYVIRDGIVVIPKGAVVPDGTVI